MRNRKFHLGALRSMVEEARVAQPKYLASFRVTSCSVLQPYKVVSRGWDQLEKACQVTTVLSRVRISVPILLAGPVRKASRWRF